MTTANATQLSPNRLRAPRENRGVVVDPPWSGIPRALDENIATRSGWEYDFQGISASRLIAAARAELRDAAIDWRKAYGGSVQPFDAAGPILLAGHQPQMFHPGVWLKNFALGRLAERRAATAVNLIIDSDVAANPALFLPAGSPETPDRESLAYDLAEPAVPYEERRIEDRAMFESFAVRALEKVSPFVKNPLLEQYWPMAVAQSRSRGLLGASLARSRHLLENAWGCATWEVPQSAVCDRPAFFRFAAHLLARMPHFLPIYNAAVGEYRRTHRIRNHAQPVPDLTVEGEWLEAPFWIWTAETPRRRRLFVRSDGKETLLADRQNVELRLSLSPDSDGSRAVEQLIEWRRKGVKIRSRALLTTLWARLALGDLFVHGIGGGNYDRVTDAIVERFFRRPPPHYLVLSATLHLPIERRAPPAEDPRVPAARLRELSHHPERFIEHLRDRSEADRSSAAASIAEKHRWIETPQTRENARRRCRGIRGVNERLQPWLADLRSQWQRRYDAARTESRKEKILNWREYAFCLYPEETIREFFDALLPDIR
ncbi:MAG: hypothetical protein IT426_09985 [Pirellulales bacterium]|nr:hypothetical protein [Pirellulales bacterium]